MKRISAGLLMYRKRKELEVFLVHPGGPFFKGKDDGFWGIPKGEVNEGEELFAAAQREFKEETGIDPSGNYISLGEIKMKGGKIVHAWAFEGEWNGLLVTNYFSMRLKSGEWKKFPEVDRAGFFSLSQAKTKMNAAQFEFIERLLKLITS
ncbi:NUDIX domain-containing protein [Candidatus Pacearchaeota archaeon]|nr:NUDIX domain-containing protein [Candidatus Pacearchaeota archaeon]